MAVSPRRPSGLGTVGVSAISPGQYLLEKAEGVLTSKAELAIAGGIDRTLLQAIIDGRRIDAAAADQLAAATKVSSGFWINLQTDYDVRGPNAAPSAGAGCVPG